MLRVCSYNNSLTNKKEKETESEIVADTVTVLVLAFLICVITGFNSQFDKI